MKESALDDTKYTNKFGSAVILHTKFKEVSSSLFHHMALGDRGRMIAVAGPTGVGKTTLLRFFEQKLQEHVAGNDLAEMGPPIIVEARKGELEKFNWKAFYLDILQALNEPGFEKKTNLSARLEELRSGKKVAYSQRMSTAELGGVVKNAIQMHRPIALIVDEAQHIGSSTRQRVNSLDVLKGIANGGATSLVLFGTYELREFLYESAQLAHRVKVINFGRYGTSQEDLKDFARAFVSIWREFDLPISDQMNDEIEFLYNHSLGCVGVLLAWVKRSMISASEKGDAKICKRHFKAERHSNQQLRAMSADILEFEALHEDVGDFAFLEAQAPRQVSDQPKNPKMGSGSKPGRRLPVRDKIQPTSEDEE